MSSAAKLRKYGRGTATVAVTALVMTSFGPAAFASWDDAPQTPNVVDAYQANGTIGIVDADQKAVDTQGAALVSAGQDNQALSDVRLVIPNRFVKGDVIDLQILDRSATEETDGNTNSGVDTKVEFSAAPKLGVSDAQPASTTVKATNPANNTTDKANTESTADNPWVAATGATGVAAEKPSVAPAFDVTTRASKNNGFKDTVRLTLNGNPSAGDPSGTWILTLSDLKVNLGKNVTPGELRLVPYAANDAGSGNLAPSVWFHGNSPSNAYGNTAVAREVGIYTVPAYVSPVTFEAGSPNIIAGAGAQSIGDLLIKETNGASILDTTGTGTTYTVTLEGAKITNTTGDANLKISIDNGGTNEQPTNIAVSADGTKLTFTANKTDAAKISTYKISGLLLSADKPASLKFKLSGGSVEEYLADPAGDSGPITNAGAVIYKDDDFFTSESGVAEPTRSVSTPQTVANQWINPTNVIAAAPALTAPTNGQDVLASGLWTATTDNVLTNGDYTLTRQSTGNTFVLSATAPSETSGSVSDVYTITNVKQGATLTLPAFTLTDGAGTGVVTAVTPEAGDPNLPVGAYTLVDGNGAGTAMTITGNGGTLTYIGTSAAGSAGAANAQVGSLQSATGYWEVTNPSSTLTGGAIYRVAWDGSAAPAAGAAFSISQSAGTSVAAGVPDITNTTNGTDYLPTGDWTMSADGNTFSNGSVTLTRTPSTTDSDSAYVVTRDGGVTALTGDNFTITGIPNGQTVRLGANSDVTYRLSNSSPVTVVQGLAKLPVGRYEVRQSGGDITNGTYTIEGPSGITFTSVRENVSQTSQSTVVGANNQVQVTGGAAGSVIPEVLRFTGLTAGDSFEVLAAATFNVADFGINQQDIVAPRDQLTQLGTASAGTAAIGGTNRFDTARKIAEQFGGNRDIAIIVNGLAAPDALSAGFLSQREGAPILLATPGMLPQETREALHQRGVRKVYVVGGQAAVGKAVTDQLRGTDAYMWDDAAKALKPRGAKLEVVQLGGENRYHTNWVVNTYAAAQTASAAPVGKIAVGYGQPLKTTGLVARGDQFVDALTANVLSAGRTGDLTLTRAAGSSVHTLVAQTGAPQLLDATDAEFFTPGIYTVNSAGNGLDYRATAGATADVNVATVANGIVTPNGVSGRVTGTVVFGSAFAANQSFRVTATTATTPEYRYDAYAAARVNALPVVLTTPGGLRDEAAAQFRALHLEHGLLIGGDAALSDSVKTGIEAINGASTHRLAGADRWETAKVVNEFAMAPQSVTKVGDVPGLGFNGNRTYSDAAGTNLVGGQMTVYLANGLKFPDALVAGPLVSRERNALAMTLTDDLPEGTALFIRDNAERLDNAVGLGLGNAVSTAVIVEANKIASSK